MEKSDEETASAGSSTSAFHKKIRFLKDEESAGRDGLQEYKQNPLDIPEIVAIVAGHLSEVEDLKSVRTQSKAWRDETLSKWRNSAVFLINDETIPILVKAFKDDSEDLSEEDKAAAMADRDPYRLRKVSFKRYRFANERRGQPWTYPLKKDDVEGNLIWEKVISPNATFMDVGECSLRFLKERLVEVEGHYLPGLKWILKRCPNLTEFAMAPYKSNESMKDLSESEDEGEEETLEGEVSNAERLRRKLREKFNRFKNPFLNLERFKAPRIEALTISSPKQIWKNSSKNRKSLEYLFNDTQFNYGYGDEQGCIVGQFIIGGMINLKKLQLPSGGGATSLIIGLSRSVNKKKMKLESLTAFASERKHFLKPSVLYVNLKVTHPSVRELYLTLSSQSFNKKFTGVSSILSSLEATLQKLELEVNCDPEEDSPSSSSRSKKKTLKPEFSLWGSYCKRLTHFKMTLHYETFPGVLGTFDLKRLGLIPNIEEFHFGMKDKVEEAWVTRKLNFVEDRNNPVVELEDLKLFHFHGNFKKKALNRLGGIMENLETLEVVLDEENCNGVGEIWPRLKNLKLLEGSDVPDEFLSNLKKSNPSLQRLEYL